MGYGSKIFLIILASILYKVYDLTRNPPLPTLEENPWWGPEKPGKDNPAVRPFSINIAESDIEDLKARLALPLRLTSPLHNANFTYGLNSEVLEVYVNYWRTQYDWKKREKFFNSFPHFKTQIEGLDIHFIRVKPNLPPQSKLTIRPLLLIHGWPGSVFEFLEIIPLLTTPQEGSDVIFEVICPSLPGYGFSQASSKQGLGALQTAQIFFKLMERLGFKEFFVQGGDWGAFVASAMATLYSEKIYGMHSNMPFVNTMGVNLRYAIGAYLPSGFIMKKEDEQSKYPISSLFLYILEESGYMHLQATKPDTIGAVLDNSPVGLAAYILEKFSGWTNKANRNKPDGGLLSEDFPISIDKLLDNISLYWFTRSITSSVRYYAENIGNIMQGSINEITTDVAAGFSAFYHEIFTHPENFLSHKFTKIVTYKKHDVGGHFAALEVPQLLAQDIYEFVQTVERIMEMKERREL